MKRYVWTVAIAVFLANLASCGSDKGNSSEEVKNGRLSGIVYIAGVNLPISGVRVSCAGVAYTTGLDGTYSVTGLPVGPQTLTASKSDYETFVTTVNVTTSSVYDVFMSSSVATSTLSGIVRHSLYGPISGAEISVDGLVDHTDAGGHYQLPNVPQGQRVILCTHPDYNSFTESVFISSTDKTFDIQLTRTYRDVLYITRDAWLNGNFPDEHFDRWGSGGGTSCYLRADADYAGGKETMSIIGLPAPPSGVTTNMIDSVRIHLGIQTSCRRDVDRLKMARVLASWDEQTITWNSRPPEGEEYALVRIWSTDFGKFIQADITDYYRDWPADVVNGLFLRTWASLSCINIYCGEGEVVMRPYVTMHYTR